MPVPRFKVYLWQGTCVPTFALPPRPRSTGWYRRSPPIARRGLARCARIGYTGGAHNWPRGEGKDPTMLNATIKAHRPYLRANGGPQKLFVMLKLLPAPEAGRGRPRVDLALVLDTSGSMREPAPGANGQITPIAPFTLDGKTYNATVEGSSKLDVAMEAARGLLGSSHLQPDDTISLIQFDDRSQVVAAGKAGPERERLLEAIGRLTDFSGGTQMAP